MAYLHSVSPITTSFLVQVPYLQPICRSEFSNFISDDRERNGLAKTKLCESLASSDAFGKGHVQELVDHLHHCAQNKLLKEAKEIHGHVLRSHFCDDHLLVLFNHVIHAYSKCLEFRLAKLVFYNMLHRNVFSWSAMIAGSNENGLHYEAFSYFREMLDSEILPDAFVYSAILQTCIGLGCIDLGRELHAKIVISGFCSHVIVSTALLNMYAKLGQIEESYKVFNSMSEHNVVSWNTFISGLTTNGLLMEAFHHFLKMKEEGFAPDTFTLVGVSKAVGMLGDVGKGRQVQKYVSDLGMMSNVVVGTALIDMYSKCGALVDASSIFEMYFSHCMVNAPWNAMISGYSQGRRSQEALELFARMHQNNIKADLHTYCSVFDAVADLKNSRVVRVVHGMVIKSGYDLMGRSVANAIGDAYSKCALLEDVKKIFDKMKHKDIVSWSTLVTAYSQCSKWENALATFSLMRKEGVHPNHFTLASVVIACGGLCYLEYGRQLHVLLFKTGYYADKCIESALIDMYAKGGSIKEAEKVFNFVCEPDIVSLTAMISGYAQHGFVSDVLCLFRRMEEWRIKPNGVTFLCVLFACSHGGLVKEGLDFFWSMERDYGLVPEMEHYACIVDLLGRVGLLNEAYEFIIKMPLEPDEIVWQALLAACRTHGDIEMGEIAAKRILSTCPEYSATYVLLSNTYMERGSFRDGIRLRNVMKEQGIRKEPGFSWICVGGKVHRFYAGDQHHPQKDAIYLKLEELRNKIEALGYTPDLHYALQVED